MPRAGSAPQYEKIAEAAHCARSTVPEAIKALEDAGILSWVHGSSGCASAADLSLRQYGARCVQLARDLGRQLALDKPPMLPLTMHVGDLVMVDVRDEDPVKVDPEQLKAALAEALKSIRHDPDEDTGPISVARRKLRSV
jgi:hypothetical protein